MTKGRPPREAIKEAMKLARDLGEVREGPDTQQLPAHFTVFMNHVTLYARVRRPQVRIDGPLDLLDKYSDDVLQVKRIPFTPVVIHEFWAGLRNGTWQFFRITTDTILEIQTCGVFDRTHADCDPSFIAPDPSGINRNPRAVARQDPGLVCPIIDYLKGRTIS